MSDDWASLTFMLLAASAFGAIFIGYVRAGMHEAEAEWRMRTRLKYCVRCGYSLRGNVSGICPECGKGIRD